MKIYCPRLLCCFIGLAALGAAIPENVSAENRFRQRPPHLQNNFRLSQQRQLYRPRIKAVRGASGARVFRLGQSIPYGFYARRGGVSKIEVRSGLKVIKVIYPGGASRGSGSIRLRRSDFARAGVSSDKPKIKLWAWQARSSYKSVHGESIGYTLVP